MTRLAYIDSKGRKVILSETEALRLRERDADVRREWTKWHRRHPGGTVILLKRPADLDRPLAT